jgi:hypothetical protein
MGHGAWDCPVYLINLQSAVYVVKPRVCMDENKTVAIRVEMPPDLRNRFKSAVARDGKNMRDVLLEFIKEIGSV